MKKYIITSGHKGFIGIDTDTFNVEQNQAIHLSFDYAFLVKEDGIISYNGKNIEVKKGNLVLTTYVPVEFEEGDSSTKRIYIIKNSDELLALVKDYTNYDDYRSDQYKTRKAVFEPSNNVCCDKAESM